AESPALAPAEARRLHGTERETSQGRPGPGGRRRARRWRCRRASARARREARREFPSIRGYVVETPDQPKSRPLVDALEACFRNRHRLDRPPGDLGARAPGELGLESDPLVDQRQARQLRFTADTAWRRTPRHVEIPFPAFTSGDREVPLHAPASGHDTLARD